ncbi:MAG: hypothetical protein BZY88_19310 [SAR202 cluster bacterium Io17-Chloro-G9]|nr:MAG: hypothetical protein BZY88_19310 [SAR202 cluster bacterium Io17-Chloro-G9]
MPANFWMIVCNPENYRITQNLGFTIQGLKSQQRRKLQRVGAGDRILFYVSGTRRFTATATATSSYFPEETPVWDREGGASWPFRVKIKPEVVLEDAQCIDANMLAPRLEYVKRWPPENWYMAFQGNLHLLPKSDFLLVEEEMKKLRYGNDYVPTPFLMPSDSNRRKSSSRRHKRNPNQSARAAGPGAGPGNSGSAPASGGGRFSGPARPNAPAQDQTPA